ncbi:MAG: DEAD/DEAH box helicase family protein [Candidatus Omnitrophota bacterium]|nr:DEAD/DEAH box helicase family protein [Candidatus Omnitrophota bacterium]
MEDNQKSRAILQSINDLDNKISSLNQQKQQLIHELKSASIGDHTVNIPTDFSLENNLRLFKELFRGRTDVYAKHWTNRKTGKFGYSPVCKNEWAPNICQKATARCSKCPHREFVPFDASVITKHLNGSLIAGIYPLLDGDVCYFLAVDFDKEGWQDNIAAFKQTCLEYNVPLSIERSRSGNGAHAWVFFEDKLPAFTARRLGSFLITETMSKRYQLDMKSYDRLFPNQDTLPNGGFGNLIALPLQKEAAKFGNSLFIDDHFKPYSGQWQFLASVKKMSIGEAQSLANNAASQGKIIGVRISPIEENDPPWLRLPSGKKRYLPIIGNLPESIELTIANKIYIKTDTLPSVLLNQLKRLAAFQNPEFYHRQSMRLSTSFTPRVICCSEIMDGYLALPRGCFDDACCVLNEYGIKTDIKDERNQGISKNFRFHGKLTKEQKSVTRKILSFEIGVLSAPPGTGKTVLAIYAIAKRKTNTIVLVHRKPLMEQWRKQLSVFLGVDIDKIGQIVGGKDKATGVLDVAMIQSLEEKGSVDDRVADYGFVVVDECHHIGAVSFERVMMEAKAKFVLGLTATPYRRDGQQPIIHMQCGPIVYQAKQDRVGSGILDCFLIPRITPFDCDWTDRSNIYDLWPKLLADIGRNEMIVVDVKRTVGEGRFPLILTERKEHLAILEDMLKPSIQNLAVLYGGIGIKKRRKIFDKLNSSSDAPKAILATGAYIGEGFDDPRLDTLFIAMPIAFKGKVIQYAGRLHRKHHAKTEIRVYDYVDQKVSVLAAMYKKRLKAYKTMGYEIKGNSSARGSNRVIARSDSDEAISEVASLPSVARNDGSSAASKS